MGEIANSPSLGATQKLVGTAIVGGISAELQGGKFGHGFLSAGVGYQMGTVTGGPVTPGKLLAVMIVGGTVSEITGGKFANGAATAGFAYVAVAGAASNSKKILANPSESNEAGIRTLENLPDNPEAIYQDGRELAAAQESLNVDENVQYDPRHAFCPSTCNTDTIRYRSTAEGGVEFLKNNRNYNLLLGAHVGGIAYIYPGATVSKNFSYPFGTAGYRKHFTGTGPGGITISGTENVLRVIGHETGHQIGIGHGALMDRREYYAIMGAR